MSPGVGLSGQGIGGLVVCLTGVKAVIRIEKGVAHSWCFGHKGVFKNVNRVVKAVVYCF